MDSNGLWWPDFVRMAYNGLVWVRCGWNGSIPRQFFSMNEWFSSQRSSRPRVNQFCRGSVSFFLVFFFIFCLTRRRAPSRFRVGVSRFWSAATRPRRPISGAFAPGSVFCFRHFLSLSLSKQSLISPVYRVFFFLTEATGLLVFFLTEFFGSTCFWLSILCHCIAFSWVEMGLDGLSNHGNGFYKAKLGSKWVKMVTLGYLKFNLVKMG